MKICKHHGELTPEKIRCDKRTNGKSILTCRLCRRIAARKSYHKHPDRGIKKSQLWRKNNPEKSKEYARKARRTYYRRHGK